MKIKLPSFSKSKFTQWVLSLPDEATFAYWDNHDCALANFIKSQGFKNVWVGGKHCIVNGRGGIPLPKWLWEGMAECMANTLSRITKTHLLEFCKNHLRMNNFLFQVKATRKDTKETWLIYKGATFTKEMAEATAKECKNIWGKDIKYEVIPAPVTKV